MGQSHMLDHIAVPLRQFAVPTDSLNLDPKNARHHTKANLDSIRRSFKRFGQRLPIIVQKQGMVVRAGNGRLTVARLLGWTHIAAVVVDEAEVEAVAFALADNRTADLASWDDENLAAALKSILDSGLPDLDDLIGATGYDRNLVDEIVGSHAATAEDDVPVGDDRVVSVLGDVWLMGGHRLAVGDCTDSVVVASALAGERPNVMGTDPPYGVEYDPKWRDRVGSSLGRAAKRAVGRVANDARDDWREAWALFPGDVAYVWHADLHATAVWSSLEAAGFVPRYQIIWAKPRLVVGRGHYHVQHEPCWYAVRKGGTASWYGGRDKTSLWQIAQDPNTTGHGTQKPVELMRRPMLNHTRTGELVYDPFVGSGTSIIAAETCGRRCAAIELNPAYADICVRRWETFTGKAACDVEGRAFAQRLRMIKS